MFRFSQRSALKSGLTVGLSAIVASTLLSATPAPAAYSQGTLEVPLETTTLPDLPTARDGVALATDGEDLLAVGGADKQGVLGVVDRYDAKTGRWKRLTDQLLPRRHASAAVVDGKLWVFGGRADAGPIGDVEVVDLASGFVEEAPAMPTPRYFASATVYRGHIWVAGGTVGWGRSGVVEVFDPRVRRWYIAPSLAEARDTQLVVAGDRLYALGGYAGPGQPVSTMVERLDTDRWVPVSRMPAPTSSFAAVAAGGQIYTFGDHRDLGRVLRFDPRAGRWTELQVGFFPRRHAAAVAIGTAIYVVGGHQTRPGSFVGIVERLEVAPGEAAGS